MSEAHALVSLRGEALQLLRLRGAFAVEGKRVDRVDLVEGVCVAFAPGVSVTVRERSVPGSVPAIVMGDGRVVPLESSVYHLAGPPWSLRAGYVGGAPLVLWCDGVDWWGSRPSGPAWPLTVGPVEVEGTRIELVLLSAGRVAIATTEGRGRVSPPVHLHIRALAVHVTCDAVERGTLDGQFARVVRELYDLGGTAPWTAVAHEVWPRERDEAHLRVLWDQCLYRLRGKLDELGLRRDLIRTHGRGEVELYLLPGDAVSAD